MSNKHSNGPRCPFCPKREFKTRRALVEHQIAKNHFPNFRAKKIDDVDAAARAQMAAYDADKRAAG